MQLLILAGAVLFLLGLILLKLNPALALLIASLAAGPAFGMTFAKTVASVNTGIGSTLGSLVMVLTLGAMFGKIVEESGAAEKIVAVMLRRFKLRNVQWAMLLTGLLVGIPLFYNAGFVVLISLVFTVSRATGLPPLYAGMPTIASLSITHGFLPPHPGPLAIAAVFKADVGNVLLYGLALSVPVAVVAGIVLPRLLVRVPTLASVDVTAKAETALPSAAKSFAVASLPVLFIAMGTAGARFASTPLQRFFEAVQEPVVALLLALLIGIAAFRLTMDKAMQQAVRGVKEIAVIVLIIGAGGGFKQVLIDSGIGNELSAQAAAWAVEPLVLGWAVAAVLRVALGSATVAALTASGLVVPLLAQGASPELMVLSVGAGSLFCSHVNDTGFWMFKEYFGLSVKQTFRTWTVMETIISVMGLAGVLVLKAIV